MLSLINIMLLPVDNNITKILNIKSSSSQYMSNNSDYDLAMTQLSNWRDSAMSMNKILKDFYYCSRRDGVNHLVDIVIGQPDISLARLCSIKEARFRDNGQETYGTGFNDGMFNAIRKLKAYREEQGICETVDI